MTLYKIYLCKFLTGLALCSILVTTQGCVSAITGNNVQQLSPEQIEAYGKIKQNVLGCTMIGGPPVGGRSTLLILPPDYPVTVKFGPDCQILNQ